ncbi:MAG: hypothetical protein WDN67_04370 [Candidatus Moraniibacteriota bacterium]
MLVKNTLVKRSEIYFSAIQVPIDVAMILLAATSAYFLRSVPIFQDYISKVFTLSFSDYLESVAYLTPAFILIFALEGLYTMRVTRRFWAELYAVGRATSLSLIVLIVAVFLNREWFSSRFVIIFGWGFAILYIALARLIIQQIQKWFLVRRGVGVHRVLLIGSGDKMKSLKQAFKRDRGLGYRVVDQIDDASITRIKEIQKARGVDEIIIGDTSLTDEELGKLLDYCQINNITYKYVPTFFPDVAFYREHFPGRTAYRIPAHAARRVGQDPQACL